MKTSLAATDSQFCPTSGALATAIGSPQTTNLKTTMQKTFAMVLLLCSSVAAFGQGTVTFNNGAFNKISIGA
jgi:hypothetical protein